MSTMLWTPWEPDGRQQWAWSSAHLCMYCGAPYSDVYIGPLRQGEHRGDECFARHCDSCSTDWLTPESVRAENDGSLGYEDCPDCRGAA